MSCPARAGQGAIGYFGWGTNSTDMPAIGCKRHLCSLTHQDLISTMSNRTKIISVFLITEINRIRHELLQLLLLSFSKPEGLISAFLLTLSYK